MGAVATNRGDATGELNMDRQVLQDFDDDCRSDLPYGEITEEIIYCAFEVFIHVS